MLLDATVRETAHARDVHAENMGFPCSNVCGECHGVSCFNASHADLDYIEDEQVEI